MRPETEGNGCNGFDDQRAADGDNADHATRQVGGAYADEQDGDQSDQPDRIDVHQEMGPPYAQDGAGEDGLLNENRRQESQDAQAGFGHLLQPAGGAHPVVHDQARERRNERDDGRGTHRDQSDDVGEAAGGNGTLAAAHEGQQGGLHTPQGDQEYLVDAKGE